MTRKEAEERIIRDLYDIRNTYLTYNEDGDWLNVSISKDYLRCDNALSYGGADYDKPLSIFIDLRKEEY